MGNLTELLIILLTFLLAGSVKGVIGMGLPTVSLLLLAIAFDLPTAMVLLVIPALLTNIWQAIDGKQTLYLIKRIWPFLLTATLSVAVGSIAFTRIPLNGLSTLLGTLLAVYALLNLTGVSMSVAHNRETLIGGTLGFINGSLGGMTGSFVFPGVLYLQALGMPRDSLIQAMGLLFSLSALALGAGLYSNGLVNDGLAVQSALGVVPAFIGMHFGKKLRQNLNDETFKKLFFITILVMAMVIIWRSIY